MALSNGPLITAAESQRRLQRHNQWMQNYRIQKRTRLKQMLFQGVRGIFIFLLGATIVTFVVAHRNEIDALARQKISRAVAHVQTKSEAADSLRQSALNHENEVNEAGR